MSSPPTSVRRPRHALRASSPGWVGAVLVGFIAACGAPHIDKPPAPDMRPLVESYENPDARFDTDDAEEVGFAIAAIDALLEQTDLREQLVEVLEEVLDQAVDLSNENDDAPISVDADGYMLVTRICTGWTEPERPDRSENGALLVTATFSNSGLDPIVWGDAETCRYRAGDSQVELDQARGARDSVSVYWGEGVERQDLAERALLVDLSLDATIDGITLALDFDFRSLQDGTLEYRIGRADGSLIARVADDDRIRVRAANGIFECDASLDCSQVDAP